MEHTGGERRVRRKPVPSYVPPLGYDEALLLSSAHTPAYDWESGNQFGTSVEDIQQRRVGDEMRPKATFMAANTEYELVDATTYDKKVKRAPPKFRRRWNVFQGWWQEVIWCLISLACIIVLVTVLQSYDNQPLPNWPHGLTLNTVVAFISTFCRTSFVLPVVEGLSQYKWNWYKSPRPLGDFKIFDEASRGPWGSLRLLATTKGRVVGILSAAILVTGIATSTLTQSVVAYPTRQVELPGNDTALTLKNDGYFWVTANTNAQNKITSDGDPMELDVNSTLPNGVTVSRPYGYAALNISTGWSLSYNDTDVMKAAIFNFFVLYGPPMRATEIMLHWCVNTYNVTVKENIPVTQRVASYTHPTVGEVFIENYNMTSNTTYLTSPDSPQKKYVASGYGPDYIASTLKNTLVGGFLDLGGYQFGNGTQMFGTALSRAKIGISLLDESQKYDDAQFQTLRNLTENIASGLTNAWVSKCSDRSELLTKNISGSAWQDERFVSIRWPWLTLLAAQVGLSILTLIIIMIQTAGLDIEIVKGSPLPALLAVSSEEKAALLNKDFEDTHKNDLPHLKASGIAGALRRNGQDWVLRDSRG
ncbi:hypothetical protein CCHL11_07147 [Colletotrichum chlorophyti]|uniref:Uncharacterized protein n=1 Tax=Colletotrichum chlorophyti TaxID=708187 RepID=A0A1Q8S0L6_9PEZI|nr:hypothetical protein CCHL11_07147 [Colletotrichum chlorophyti]